MFYSMLFFYFDVITLVENVPAGYLHPSLSGANSICSQLIEQFAQQFNTIGHQCDEMLMYVTDLRSGEGLQRGRKLNGCFTV